MLRIHLRALLLNSASLKISSLFIGYALWLVMSEQQITTRTVHTPVCFYNISATSHIKAPESVIVTLMGTHMRLRALDSTALSIHIDASKLSEGMNTIKLTSTHLLLPPGVNLLHYTNIQLLHEIKKT